MLFKFRSLLIIVCLLSTNLAFGQPMNDRLDTSHVVTFGDSLTDNDLLFLLPPPFGNVYGPIAFGQDPAEAFFSKAANPDDQLSSFAVLGSVSGRGDCSNPFEETCGVLSQVEKYVAMRKAGTIAPATFISLQAGGNDILDIENNFANLFALASAAPNENWQIDLIIDEIKFNLFLSVAKLKLVDHAPITVWTAPDVTLSPLVLSFWLTAEQSANVRAHVEELNEFIRSLETSKRTKLLVLDAGQVLTNNTFAPPEILGTPILPSIVGAFGERTDQFADPIHPTAVINAILANELIDKVNNALKSDVQKYSELELAIIAGIVEE